MNRLLFFFALLFLPLVAFAAPANDSAVNATLITGASGNFTIVNTAATSGSDDPTGYKTGAGHSVWYKWVAPSSGVFEWVITNTADVDLGLIFCTGNPATTLTAIPAQKYIPYAALSATPERTRMNAVSGTTYYILADDLAGTGTVTTATATWNAIPTGTFSLEKATDFAYLNNQGVGVIINRTGGTSGSFSFNYTITPLTADPSIFSNLTPGATNTFSGTVVFASGDTSAFISVGLSLGANHVPGETFKVQITPTDPYLPLGITTTTFGIYNNDNFAEAGPIVGPSGSVDAILGTNLVTPFATVEAGEPIHGPSGSLPQISSVWFDWVAPSSGPFVFESFDEQSNGTGSDDPAPFSIYTGTSLADLVRVQPLPFQELGEYRQAFVATAGTHYKIGLREGTKPFTESGLSWQPASTISFSTTSYTVAETDGTLNIVVNRTADTSTTAFISVSTSDGTANSFDYDPINTQLFFDVGETTKTIPLTVHQDGEHEVTETVNLTLSLPENDAYVPVTTAVVSITSADPFVARAGTFSAVLDNGHAAAKKGTVTITSSVTGKLTGKVVYGGKTYAIKGTLDADGTATIPLTKPGAGQLVLTLESTGGANRFDVSFTDGTDTTTANADIRPYDGKNNLAPSFGTYTAKLLYQITASSPGIATITVGLNGTVKIVGSLSDGTPYTASSSLSVVPDFGLGTAFAPFHIPLYKNAGYLSGQINFGTDAQTPVTAEMVWFKPPLPKEKFYPAGVDTDVDLSGEVYTPPTPGVRALPGLPVNGELSITLDGPGFPTTTNHAYWLVNNLVSTGLFTNPKLQLKVAAKTGLITGTVTIPGTKPLALPLKGIILQGTKELAGFYLHAPSKTSGAFTGQP